MAGVGSVAAAAIMASATKKAAREQADALREIYRWGYGYPDWLIKAIHKSIDDALAAREKMTPQEEQRMRELGPEAYEQYQEIDRLAEAWDTTNREQMYKDIAKSGFGTSSRALEELGLTGGALERAQQQQANQLAMALQGAGERGEQQQRQALLQKGQLHQTAAGMLPAVGDLSQLPMQNEMYYQNMLNAALGMATGIPGYQYTPPQVPRTGQFMGPAIAGAMSDLGQAFAYNQGMQQGYGQQPYSGGYGGGYPQYYNQQSPQQAYGGYSHYQQRPQYA
jgi:hypothetical protein